MRAPRRIPPPKPSPWHGLPASPRRSPSRVALQAASGVNKPRRWQTELQLQRSREPFREPSVPALLCALRVFQQSRVRGAQLYEHHAGRREAVEAARTKAVEECHGAVPVPSNPTWQLLAIRWRRQSTCIPEYQMCVVCPEPR